MVDWMLGLLSRQGIEDYLMVVKGKENRFQIKHLVGYGESHGVRVRYWRSRHDSINRGSADATLLNLEYLDITQPAFVFPMDSILEVDLRRLLEHHQRAGAVVTIVSHRVSLARVIGKYGLLVSDAQGYIRGFVEKPSREEAEAVLGRAVSGRTKVHINAGFYLIDSVRAGDSHAAGAAEVARTGAGLWAGLSPLAGGARVSGIALALRAAGRSGYHRRLPSHNS